MSDHYPVEVLLKGKVPAKIIAEVKVKLSISATVSVQCSDMVSLMNEVTISGDSNQQCDSSDKRASKNAKKVSTDCLLGKNILVGLNFFLYLLCKIVNSGCRVIH